MGHQAIAVPARWKTIEWDTKQQVFLHTGKYQRHQNGTPVNSCSCTIKSIRDTKQQLFLHTGKYQGHQNGTPSSSCSCTLESIRDTRMEHQSIAVSEHWKALRTLEWDTNQQLFLPTGKYQGHQKGTPIDSCACKLKLEWDTKQQLFLNTEKYQGHQNGTSINSCSSTLESIGDTIM